MNKIILQQPAIEERPFVDILFDSVNAISVAASSTEEMSVNRYSVLVANSNFIKSGLSNTAILSTFTEEQVFSLSAATLSADTITDLYTMASVVPDVSGS